MLRRNSKHTFGENQLHHWFFTEHGWIRMTENGLQKSLESARSNKEDEPKIGWLKKQLIKLINIL